MVRIKRIFKYESKNNDILEIFNLKQLKPKEFGHEVVDKLLNILEKFANFSSKFSTEKNREYFEKISENMEKIRETNFDLNLDETELNKLLSDCEKSFEVELLKIPKKTEKDVSIFELYDSLELDIKKYHF